MHARATRSPIQAARSLCMDVTRAWTARRRSLDRGALRRARVEPRVDSMRGRFCSLAPAARTYAYTPTRLHRLTDTQTHRHTPTLQHSNTPPQAFVGARYERQARAFVPPALGAGHAAPGAGGRRKQPYMTMHTSNPSSCRLLCGSGLLFFIAGCYCCDAGTPGAGAPGPEAGEGCSIRFCSRRGRSMIPGRVDAGREEGCFFFACRSIALSDVRRTTTRDAVRSTAPRPFSYVRARSHMTCFPQGIYLDLAPFMR